jgi:hypothetical protein
VPQDLSALWPLHQLQLDLLRWMSSIGEGVMEKNGTIHHDHHDFM